MSGGDGIFRIRRAADFCWTEEAVDAATDRFMDGASPEDDARSFVIAILHAAWSAQEAGDLAESREARDG